MKKQLFCLNVVSIIVSVVVHCPAAVGGNRAHNLTDPVERVMIVQGHPYHFLLYRYDPPYLSPQRFINEDEADMSTPEGTYLALRSAGAQIKLEWWLSTMSPRLRESSAIQDSLAKTVVEKAQVYEDPEELPQSLFLYKVRYEYDGEEYQVIMSRGKYMGEFGEKVGFYTFIREDDKWLRDKVVPDPFRRTVVRTSSYEELLNLSMSPEEYEELKGPATSLLAEATALFENAEELFRTYQEALLRESYEIYSQCLDKLELMKSKYPGVDYRQVARLIDRCEQRISYLEEHPELGLKEEVETAIPTPEEELIEPAAVEMINDEEAVAAAQDQIDFFNKCLGIFYVHMGRFPTAEEGLEALVKQPTGEGADRWQGPYLKEAEIPLDPWGNPYVYVYPGRINPDYDIISYGADGVPGGTGAAADITN